MSATRGIDILALNEALESLAEIDARKARVVELRYFGGLSADETAEVLGITPIRVKPLEKTPQPYPYYSEGYHTTLWSDTHRIPTPIEDRRLSAMVACRP